ncbi:MAG: hypothetical protein JXR06_03505 [Candidatus Atelocyanobacterium thalassa]|uniref:Glycosyltransferase RgtA/B/C/D-like domain-containing protein n=1 Tax=Candidatus Atelocyanobacterium thalassa isolate SIO64986 TaxID=1527444 RepID=A0A086CG20_9CHRO|nr:MAG: hypothetical protein ucyna2_01041 [Candidatus Atelocyanobacterium thalassa isolate SIO64986]
MLKKIRNVLSSEFLSVIFALIIVVSVAIYFYFIEFDKNITGFFRIGSVLPISPYLYHNNLFIYQKEIGYDGQQFLNLALDPFLNHPETLDSLDHPVYRYRRILYPLISYLFALGNKSLIPYIMIGINIVSITLIVYVISLHYREKEIVSPYKSLLALCIPSIWIVLSLGTSDLLSSLFLVTSLYNYYKNNYRSTALMISLGCLTRETLLVVWASLFISSLLENKHKQIKYLLYGIILPILWTFYIILLDLPGKTRIDDNFGIPFLGIFHKFINILTNGINTSNLFELYMFILLLTSFIIIPLSIKKNSKDNLLIQICNIFYGIIFIFSSFTVLSYYLDYSRVFMDVYFLLLFSLNHIKTHVRFFLISCMSFASCLFLIFYS